MVRRRGARKESNPFLCACFSSPGARSSAKPKSARAANTARSSADSEHETITTKQQEQQKVGAPQQQQQQQQQQLPSANGELHDAAATVKPTAARAPQVPEQKQGPPPQLLEGAQAHDVARKGSAQQPDRQPEIVDDKEVSAELHKQEQQQHELQKEALQPQQLQPGGSLKSQGSSKQWEQQQQDHHHQAADPPAAAAAAVMPPGKGPEAGLLPPLQPLDSEKNTEDDAGSDSDLSDPGEYEKYGPSNSDDEAVDEFGNPIPKDTDRLPKGVDTTGVTGGKFGKGHVSGSYHAAESPLFSDMESQMTGVREYKSIDDLGRLAPKEVPAADAAAGMPNPVLPWDKDHVPAGAKTNFAYKEDGEDEDDGYGVGMEQMGGSIKSSHTSSSVDTPRSSPRGAHGMAVTASEDMPLSPGDGASLKGQESVTAQAGTPAAALAPRYAALVPSHTPKAPPAHEGEPGQGLADPSAPHPGEGAESAASTPAKPRYASLVPPRKPKAPFAPTPTTASAEPSAAPSHTPSSELDGSAAEDTKPKPAEAADGSAADSGSSGQAAPPKPRYASLVPPRTPAKAKTPQPPEQAGADSGADGAQQQEQQREEAQERKPQEEAEQQHAEPQQLHVEPQPEAEQAGEEQQQPGLSEGGVQEVACKAKEEQKTPLDAEAIMNKQADKEGERSTSPSSSGAASPKPQQQPRDGTKDAKTGGGAAPRALRSASMHGMDQSSRLQARRAERDAAHAKAKGDGNERTPPPLRACASYKPGLPRFMQPTVASEQLLAHHSHPSEEHTRGRGGSSQAPARPFSASTAGGINRGGSLAVRSSIPSLEAAEAADKQQQLAWPKHSSSLPRFMQPTVAAASLFGNTKEVEARIQAVHEQQSLRRTSDASTMSAGVKGVERRRAFGSALSPHSSTNMSDGLDSGGKAVARPRPDTSNLPRFMQPTVAAQAHTVYGYEPGSEERPSRSTFDLSHVLQPEEPEGAAQPEGGNARSVSGRSARSPSQRRSTTPQQQRAGSMARPSRLPSARAASPSRALSPRSPPDTSHLPRFMQPTTATIKHQSRPGVNKAAAATGARPGSAPAPPPGRSPSIARPPTALPYKVAAPTGLSVAGSVASQEDLPRTPTNGQDPAPTHTQQQQQQQQQQQGVAPTPLTNTGLNFGEWALVRLKKSMPCDACKGTAQQETVDGEAEVFQCDQVLQPKALAVVISHEVESGEAEGGGTEPKTWVFCPDPLCLDSRPLGSRLPARPNKIQLKGGTKITRVEYNELKELGLEVGGNAPATPPQAPHAQPQDAPTTPTTPAA